MKKRYHVPGASRCPGKRFTPLTGEYPNANGYSVVRIDPATKESEPFFGTRAPEKAGPFPIPVPGTGVIWRITKKGATQSGPPANLSAMPPKAFSEKK